jgi:hypothetical protein
MGWFRPCGFTHGVHPWYDLAIRSFKYWLMERQRPQRVPALWGFAFCIHLDSAITADVERMTKADDEVLVYLFSFTKLSVRRSRLGGSAASPAALRACRIEAGEPPEGRFITARWHFGLFSTFCTREQRQARRHPAGLRRGFPFPGYRWHRDRAREAYGRG